MLLYAKLFQLILKHIIDCINAVWLIHYAILITIKQYYHLKLNVSWWCKKWKIQKIEKRFVFVARTKVHVLSDLIYEY